MINSTLPGHAGAVFTIWALTDVRFMWQVLQSLDAAVRIDEAVRQLVKAAFETLGRVNADITASGQRAVWLTSSAHSHAVSRITQVRF